MRIKMEIDMKPEELQRFLGMPDVAAMREEILRFIKERVAADPAGFLMDNLDRLGKSRPVRRFLYGARAGREDSEG
jgi:hypothetical protein